jgi:hypothetical protein
MVPEIGAFVPVAPYDNHFVYETNVKQVGIPSYMCTCGAPAVVVNVSDPKNRMFVCLFHLQNGRHTMSS